MSSWRASGSSGEGVRGPVGTLESRLLFLTRQKPVAGLTPSASGAQNTPNDSTHGGNTHSGEGGFAEEEEEETDGELKAWELSEGTCCPPREQTADLFNEDWDLELKADQGNPYDADDIQGSISQEIKPWLCCAPQGDMIYDPSWHHPPPLIPHYSKMVFETGQFDDAED
uniref:Coordinator of PRMT5 and differentiation stimulator isoform X2 n=1 Tax=Castor canadensis TaxID=51338 RepID=A0A8B7W4Y9_CASCN|nr:coordinator of PRMT5 and differentiation stimulator isoform X2 [Castor canadensis]